MRHLKNIVTAVLIGIVLAAVADQFTTSMYPSCDLVVKGIGVSTYGCANAVESPYPCENNQPNSQSIKDCVQQNYYKIKTFPFGFKQPFGATSNIADAKPRQKNEITMFAIGFALTLVVCYSAQAIKKPIESRGAETE